MALAYLDACGDRFVNSSTFLNSAVDYEGAGALATVFSDASTVDGLVRRIEKKGYLEGKEMARTFDLLRANDLIFRYVVERWLLGQPAARVRPPGVERGLRPTCRDARTPSSSATCTWRTRYRKIATKPSVNG